LDIQLEEIPPKVDKQVYYIKHGFYSSEYLKAKRVEYSYGITPSNFNVDTYLRYLGETCCPDPAEWVAYPEIIIDFYSDEEARLGYEYLTGDKATPYKAMHSSDSSWCDEQSRLPRPPRNKVLFDRWQKEMSQPTEEFMAWHKKATENAEHREQRDAKHDREMEEYTEAVRLSLEQVYGSEVQLEIVSQAQWYRDRKALKDNK